MRGHDDLLEAEQRRIRAGLLRPHVDARAGDPPVDDRFVERSLVDDATTGCVDDPHVRLDLVQRLVADQARAVSGVFGRWTVMKSLVASSSSSGTIRMPICAARAGWTKGS